MKPFIIALSALVFTSAFADPPEEPPEEAANQNQEVALLNLENSPLPQQTRPACRVSPFVLSALTSGTRDLDMYLGILKDEVKKCGVTFADIGIGKQDLERFKQKSCVAEARHEYLKLSGGDRVGERVYRANLRTALQKCKVTKQAMEEMVCRLAPETRYRSGNYCANTAGPR